VQELERRRHNDQLDDVLLVGRECVDAAIVVHMYPDVLCGATASYAPARLSRVGVHQLVAGKGRL